MPNRKLSDQYEGQADKARTQSQARKARRAKTWKVKKTVAGKWVVRNTQNDRTIRAFSSEGNAKKWLARALEASENI